MAKWSLTPNKNFAGYTGGLFKYKLEKFNAVFTRKVRKTAIFCIFGHFFTQTEIF